MASESIDSEGFIGVISNKNRKPKETSSFFNFNFRFIKSQKDTSCCAKKTHSEKSAAKKLILPCKLVTQERQRPPLDSQSKITWRFVMINQSRLSTQPNLSTTRLGQDDAKAVDRTFPGLDDGDSQIGGLLAGFQNNLSNPTLAGTNSFNELLAMSKLNTKQDIQPSKAAAKNDNDKRDADEPNKVKSESGNARKATNKDNKAKNKDSDDNSQEQATLTQLLLAQHGNSKVNENAAAQQQMKQIAKSGEPVKTTAVVAQVVPTEQIKDDNQQNTLADVMKALDTKIDALKQHVNVQHHDQVLEKHQALVNPKSDELADLASKFDSVKFDFSQSPGQATNQNKINQSEFAQNQLAKEMQARDVMQKLAEKEWAQNDLTLRDLVSQQAMQDAAIERLGLERIENLAQLKNAQLDKLQLQNLQSEAALRQLQLKEVQSANQPQWQSYNDLSADQKAIVDALSSTNSGSAAGVKGNSNSFAASLGLASKAPVQAQTGNNLTSTVTADAVGGLQNLASLAGEGGASAGGNNSQTSSNSGRGDTQSVSGVGAARGEQTKGLVGTEEAEGKNETQNTRESERTREMARSAALRAQSIASELSAKGGGTAKVQIKDSQLGVVELRINMSDNNRVNVELVANSDRIKRELEKQTDELKAGLEKHKVVLEGVHFATDTKLGESGFQNDKGQNSQQQQQQQQQNFSSFSQNGSGMSQNQQSFGQERFFEAPKIPLNNSVNPTAALRKNYPGKNEAKTNVQRDANGSLKVIA